MMAGKRKIQRAYVPMTALAQAIKFEDDMMQVFLTDDWPEIDEDLSVANLLSGGDPQSA